ncbi:MAG TPA: sulfotransferase [Acidimicrobiales bacterium]|nr:sulfotransferase [Acidimicrobiales bacterium]
MTAVPGLWDPPEIGPGEEVGPPDFVGVGMQRCGTTRWYDLLCLHPAVHHPPGRQKELHHFDHGWERPELADPDLYDRYFPRPAGTLVGEWTPRYLSDPWTPALLARAAPRAKVLVLLRDPIDRVRSALAHERGRHSAPPTWIVADAVARGRYDEHLDRLLRWFPSHQVCVQLYETCVDDPWGALARTHAFLGLDPVRPDDEHLQRRVNAVAGDPLDAHLVERLREEYVPVVERLAARWPDLDLGRWHTTLGR